MSIEAMKQAREAMISMTGWNDWSTKAFNDLTKAIEQAEKPVAYTTGHCKEKAQPNGCQLHNLHCGYPACDRKAVATPQPQRAWVGLTQQDIDIAFDDTQEGGGFNEFAEAIEQILRRKNT